LPWAIRVTCLLLATGMVFREGFTNASFFF
jgi:hypothetical protein